MSSFYRFSPRVVVLSAFLVMPPAMGFAQSGEGAAFEVFEEVLDKIEERYVTTVSRDDLIEAAIAGAVKSLDPHSDYLPPVELEEMSTSFSGNFGGIGIEITTENDTPKVVSPIDDTPAALAGLESGDLIIAADGVSLIGLPLNDVVGVLRGEVGAPVVLTIVRDGETEPFDVELVRDTIQIQAARVRMEGDVAIIRVSTFNRNTTRDILEGVERVASEHEGDITGAIIDLRNNPGGLLDQANSVSSLFLDEGVITSVKGRDGNETVYRARRGDLLEGLPIVVLINQGSASASEIVAGALKDNGRATLVGMRSFGKGSVQTVLPLSNSGGLKLTTALYYTPSGRSIQALGIVPDILVERGDVVEVEEESSNQRFGEAQLRGRIDQQLLSDDVATILEQEREELERMRALRNEDRQLAAAIDAIKAKRRALP